jgi:hypothetical protein|nr:MAG TPA: hypothetical protein [Caudoviricetes sp.]
MVDISEIKSYEELCSELNNARETADSYRDFCYKTYDSFDEAWEAYVNSDIVKTVKVLSQKVRLLQQPYMDDIPDYGDIMPLEEFIQSVKLGLFTDYDGSGYYATENACSDITIYPSDITSGTYRRDFTHIVWFNK